MAARTDLNMLQNLNRKLRTGLWHIPAQWRALRRVPGWSYPSVPIKRIRVPHQHLYGMLFQRIPMLRLEGSRLGETAVEFTGSSTSDRSLTQRMVLRWHHLHTQQGMTLPDAFEQTKMEFSTKLQNLTDHLMRARKEAEDRHQKLSVAKIKRDALHEELGRPERYAERLEGLVNRALHLNPQEPHQYFSESMSRKLIKALNKEQVREKMTEKTEAVRKALDNSPLGRSSNALVVARGGPAPADADLPAGSAAASSVSGSGMKPRFPTPVASFPVQDGEPVPSPELFFQKEREWATTIHNGDKRSVGIAKDQKVTEFTRHLDKMVVEPDATLADYLAYVLHTQVVTLNSKRLIPWRPYTDYLNSKVYFQAYRLLRTGVNLSSVVTGAFGRVLMGAGERREELMLAAKRTIEKIESDVEFRAEYAAQHALDQAEKATQQANRQPQRCRRCASWEHAAATCPHKPADAPAELRATNAEEVPSIESVQAAAIKQAAAKAAQSSKGASSAPSTFVDDDAVLDRLESDASFRSKVERRMRCRACLSLHHSTEECAHFRAADDVRQANLAQTQPPAALVAVPAASTAPVTSIAGLREIVLGKAEEEARNGGGKEWFRSPVTHAKVRHMSAAPMTFQQSVTHQRLLTLLQSHLAATPLHSFRDEDLGLTERAGDDGYIPPKELPLTPFWQEMVDEKIRYKHPGESWYNARIEETKLAESELQEHDRIEKERIKIWAAQNGKIVPE